MLGRIINTEIAGSWPNWFIVPLMVILALAFLGWIFPTIAKEQGS